MTLWQLDDICPEVDPDAWVAPDANVIGRVSLAAGASVWFGATLRGDNEPITVSSGSNLQENVVVHTDPGYPCRIGENCTIGHKAMLHGCTIGDGTLVGMGATILNGATVGRFCLIGAGALVPEGRDIPDFSLVLGMPGKVVRQLDDAAREANLTSARHYAARAARFRSGLTRIEP